MISVEEALARCLALAAPLAPETVPLRQAAGRVLARPATARLTQPPFDASAMDGYALGQVAHPGAQFRVIGEAGAGHGFAGSLAAGEALRIFTGAPVPEGAVTVVLQEDVSVGGDKITVNLAAAAGDNIRPRGQDFAMGQALAAPRLLRPHDLALLAAMNLPTVEVARKPVVAIIATGDELVMPGETPRPDQIIASTGFALAALAEAAGAQARLLPIARDTTAELHTVFGLTEGADLIVTIGGASVGDHDLVGQVATELGLERAFWKIAMRPGKPLMAGRVLGIPMLGLPGNPVSAIVCAHLFMVPMLKAMQGLPEAAPAIRLARLGSDHPGNGPRAHYMRARLHQVAGQTTITPFSHQDSALLTILTEADALLIRPVNDPPRRAGEMMEFIAL